MSKPGLPLIGFLSLDKFPGFGVFSTNSWLERGQIASRCPFETRAAFSSSVKGKESSPEQGVHNPVAVTVENLLWHTNARSLLLLMIAYSHFGLGLST